MTTNTEQNGRRPFPQRTELTRKLAAKRYRHEFVDSRIRRGLPLQIRAIREARGWNQKQLGEEAGIPQANISRIENTRDSFLSFQTLLRIAEVFDVALVVKFAPFSELEEWANRPLSDIVPPDFVTDAARREEWERSLADAPAASVASLEAFLSGMTKRKPAGTINPLEAKHGSSNSPQGDRSLLPARGVGESTPQSDRPPIHATRR